MLEDLIGSLFGGMGSGGDPPADLRDRSPWRRFLYIAWVGLRPMLVVVVILGLAILATR